MSTDTKTETKYCYHCRMHHPISEMRFIESKTGKRWRCKKSILATKQGPEARAAFGRQVSEMNSLDSRMHARRLNEMRMEK